MRYTWRVDDLRHIAAWLRAELAALLAWLRSPALWGALAGGLLLWTAAYQVLPTITLAVGGDPATRQRAFDAPFLTGFNASEPANQPDMPWWQQAAPPYRWASDAASIMVPGSGGRHWIVRISAASGRPDASSVASTWQIGSMPPAELTIAAAPRQYSILGPSDGGTLRVGFQTLRLQTNDPRNLGLVIFGVSAAPIGSGLQLPAWDTLALLAACLLGAYGTVARLSGKPEGSQAAWITAILFTGLTTLLLLWARLALTLVLPALAWLALCVYLLAVGLLPIAKRAVRVCRLTVPPSDIGAALGCTLAAFLVRMGGVLHPYALFSDLGFHINNLLRVGNGRIFLLAGLPCEAGAGQAPYPPAQYLTLLPAALVTSDWQAIGWIIQGANSLLESLSAFVIWLILRFAGVGRHAALCGAILYVVAAPVLRSYSVGEMANIFGQALIAPLLLFLVAGAAHAHRRLVATVGGVLLAGTLLSHTGISLSSMAMLAAWLPLWWWHTRPQPRTIATLGVAGLLAAGVAVLLFYSAYIFLAEQNRLNAVQLAVQGLRCPPGLPLEQKLPGTLAGAFRPDGALSPLLALPGIAGMLLIRHTPLRLALLAALLGTLLSFATLIASDQAVRWQLFLYPALCIGSGALLGSLAHRHTAGRALAYILTLTLLWFGLAYWVRQIAEYLR